MSSYTKAIITGSRNYRDSERIYAALIEHGVTELIHGGCGGADTIADEQAFILGILTKSYPISRGDWKTYRGYAGPRRNGIMCRENQDAIVLAFPLGESKGTRGCIAIAKKLGMKVVVFE